MYLKSFTKRGEDNPEQMKNGEHGLPHRTPVKLLACILFWNGAQSSEAYPHKE